jgi:RHS repeat-associated protein
MTSSQLRAPKGSVIIRPRPAGESLLSVHTRYDAADNLVTLTDPDNNTTRNYYDLLNRRTLMLDALYNSATFSYDPTNNLTATVDRNGQQRQFAYDRLGRRTSESWLDSSNAVYQSYSYGYDPAGNLTSASVSDSNASSTITRTYDACGRLATDRDGFNVSRTLTYDAAGRCVTTVTSYPGSASDTLVSGYDDANRLTGRTLTTSAGAVLRVDLAYDDADHLTDVNDFNSASSSTPFLAAHFSINSRGRMWLQNWGGVEVLDYSFDRAGRLTGLNRDPTVTNGEGLSQSQLDATFRVRESDKYDNQSQLTSADTGNSQTSTSQRFDPAGNRLQDNINGTNTIGPNNQVLSDNFYTYSYDKEGNLILKDARDGTDYWAYLYDAANRLVSVTHWYTGQPHADLVVVYEYDALGRRVERDQTTYPGGTLTVSVQRYSYDGQAVAADLNADSQVQVRYVRGTDPDMLLARADVDGQNQPRALFYLTDRQDSVVALVASSAANGGAPLAVKRVMYVGFGTPVRLGTVTDRFGYTGKEYDEAVNLQYNQNRYLDVGLGRWLTQDPLGFAAGDTNLYRYVANSPTNFTDPSGEIIPLVVVGAALVLAATASMLYAADSYNRTSAMLATPLSQWSEDDRQRYASAMRRAQFLQGTGEVLGQVGLTLAVAGVVPVGGLGTGAAAGLLGDGVTQLTWIYGAKAQDSFDWGRWLAAGVSGGVAGRMGQAAVNGGRAMGSAGWSTAGRWAYAARTSATIGAVTDLTYQGTVMALGSQQEYNPYQTLLAVGIGLTMAPAMARGLRANNGACFAAGTPLLTPVGSKFVEQFRVGDLVLSRCESDPDGPITAKVVEAVFVRLGGNLHLHVNGQVLRTTSSHPFWVHDHGWVQACRLVAGDLLVSHDGQLLAVEDVFDTGEYETVYNLRVADYHTYFVGIAEWGFSVWAHNSCSAFEYGELDPETVAKTHFPEGRAKARVNLANPEETVRVKAPGADIDVTGTSSVADRKSYVVYGFVNKATGEIEYVGRARTPSGVTDTSVQKAVQERLRGHIRDGTFNPDTQAVVALGTQDSYAAHRGAEQFFYDLYSGRGTLNGNSYQPLDAVDSRTRQKSVDYLNSFFESLGYRNPGITTVIDARIAQRNGG